jgi:hypothetical protein
MIDARPHTIFALSRLTWPLRALLAVAVFAIVGPPVGGLTAWLSMAPTSQSPSPFVTGSYGEGLILAVITGALVVVAAGFGKGSWVVAIGAALLANVAFHLGTAGTAVTDIEVLSRLARAFLPASTVAALVCWALTRRLLTP